MIPLTRIRTPDIVPDKFWGLSKKKKEVELMTDRRNYLAGRLPKAEFDSSYWKSAKIRMIAESNGKCAYCEAPTTVVAHGDVEHYRPKDLYWWLAYTYDNYLYACQICNQKYKSNKFPLIPGRVQSQGPNIIATTTDDEIRALAGLISPDPTGEIAKLQNWVDELRQEEALLINPYFDNPANYFAYEADDNTEEVRIIPLRPELEPFINAAEEIYGLKRVELRNYRYERFSIYRILKETYRTLPDIALKTEIYQKIENMKADKSAFAGMIRYFDGV